MESNCSHIVSIDKDGVGLSNDDDTFFYQVFKTKKSLDKFIQTLKIAGAEAFKDNEGLKSYVKEILKPADKTTW